MHPITRVPTSIGAFIGWASQGPTDEAILVQSWSDFARQYGGLTSGSYLGYAVNQFFTNGGQQAYIVRLAWVESLGMKAANGTPTSCATAMNTTIGGTMTMWASSPGAWANGLQITVTMASDNVHFRLQVHSATNQLLESFENLSDSSTDPQYAIAVIDNDSEYVTFQNPATPGASPSTPITPSNSIASLAGGLDGTLLQPGDGNFEITLGAATASADDYGLRLLNRVSMFNLLCVPGEADAATITDLQKFCAANRAFLILDAPETVTTEILGNNGPVGTGPNRTWVSVAGQTAQSNSAYYYPWIQAPDPLVGNRGALFPPCGFVAGVYAATDATRGVWKAPAGVGADVSGVYGLQYVLTEAESGTLNAQAINCLRQFETDGNIVWGARTLAGSDQGGSQWKYVPIRRLALFLESSLYDGTQWVVFEPNDEQLWGQVRLSVGAFMQGLFLEGAFQGTTPQAAYFVKCDAENNPQASIDQGIVNILVGFAPLYPAEFVVIQIQQIAPEPDDGC